MLKGQKIQASKIKKIKIKYFSIIRGSVSFDYLYINQNGIVILPGSILSQLQAGACEPAQELDHMFPDHQDSSCFC